LHETITVHLKTGIKQTVLELFKIWRTRCTCGWHCDVILRSSFCKSGKKQTLTMRLDFQTSTIVLFSNKNH